MDGLADPTPIADALGPQLEALQGVLGRLLPGAGTGAELPAYEDLIASIEASSPATASGSSGSSAGDAHTSAHPLAGRLAAGRMHASLAYLLLDALWILMKTRGIPLSSSHPLHKELERARSYVDKVKSAAGSEPPGEAAQCGRPESDPVQAARDGPQRRVEQGPAGRFVRAALAANEERKGKLTKFADDDDDDDEEQNNGEARGEAQRSKVKLGKRKSDEVLGQDSSAALEQDPRRKKRPVDPYTEYDVDEPPPSTPAAASQASRNDDNDGSADGDEDDDGPADRSAASASDKKKKKDKKKRKKKGGKSKHH